MNRTMATGKWLALALIYLFISVMAVFVLLPFVWPVTQAFSPPPSSLYVHWPASFTFANFGTALGDAGQSLTLLKNSLIFATTAVFIGITVCSLGGYTLSRARFRWKRALMYAVLLMQVIPLTATILPYYLIVNRLGLVNTYLGVILGITTGQIPFLLWVMKGFFDSVPVELEEAAFLDGAGHLQALAKVVLPLSLPGLGAGAVLAFNASWGAFFLPLILISSPDNLPLSVGIFRSIIAYTDVDYGMMNAMALIYMAPTLVFFVFARRYLIRGAMAGALAGT